MWFKVKDILTEHEIEYGMKAVIRDGMASTAMTTFTGGVFLTAFALNLGASNYIIGLLAAIPPITQLIQIPSIYLVEKLGNRKAIVVTTSLISRMFWLLVAAIPFLFSGFSAINCLIAGLALYSVFGAVSGCAWNPWLRDLLPQARLGDFFSRRMKVSAILGIIFSLAAAGYIDYMKNSFPQQEMYGYSFLFFLGFVAGMIGVYFLATIPEPRMIRPKESMHFLKVLCEPFKDENFKNLMAFLGAWTFAVNLAAPFFTVYMLKRLNLDMAVIIALSAFSQLVHLLFLRIWGKFTDKFSKNQCLPSAGRCFSAAYWHGLLRPCRINMF